MRLRLATLLVVVLGLGGCHGFASIKAALVDGGGPGGSDAAAGSEAGPETSPDTPVEATPAVDSRGDTVVDAGTDLADAPNVPDGGCLSNDQCGANDVCVEATHTCVPSLAVIQGRVYPFESTNPNAVLNNVTVAITSTKALLQSNATGLDGRYSIGSVPLGSLIDFNLTLPQVLPGTQTSIPLTLATSVTTAIGNQTAATFDLPFVSYAWLANVAYQCGVYATASAAVMTSGHVNFDFTQRTTVLGTLLDAAGHPVAGVSQGGIVVTQVANAMEPYPNTNDNPADTDHGLAAHVCFLDVDTGTGQYVGTTGTTSTATGRFVMFRVRNARGTGEGTARVSATGFSSQTVILDSSAYIGVVTLTAGMDAVPTVQTRSFENDVYPLFTKYACIGCHSKGNDGYEMSTPRGPNGLHLDLSDTPTNVWTALTTGGYTGCDNAATPARVCPPSADASLLLKKPLAETGGTPPDHANSSFRTTDDPDYRIIHDWIMLGASR